tara:strand:- start:1085 stop:1501 length:417 start_codon:yes stop_codon:yes gene_type:complete
MKKLTAKILLKEVRKLKKTSNLNKRSLVPVTNALKSEFPGLKLVRTYSQKDKISGDYCLLKDELSKKGEIEDFWVSVDVTTDEDVGGSIDAPVYIPSLYLHDPDEGGWSLDYELYVYYDVKRLLNHVVYDAKKIFDLR